MPKPQGDFEETRKRLWDELVHLHHVWSQYLVLYGHSRERVQLLNQTARSFFASLQRLMIREVLLCISRLTDPLKSRDRDNLVLLRLLEDPELQAHQELRASLQAEIAAIRVHAMPIRKHRNRYIAHLDHATAIGADDDPLPPLPREIMDKAIERMGAAYHRYAREVYQTDVSFEVAALGDAESLTAALERGQKWRGHEIAEMRRQFGIQAGETTGLIARS